MGRNRSCVDPASVSAVAARARTENFPVASLLFPRALRPHLRAVYGFARLVDLLGDEFSADWFGSTKPSSLKGRVLAGDAGKARAFSETTSTDVLGDPLA